VIHGPVPGPPVGEEGGLKARARVVLGGGAALYLAAISFIHWVNRDSLDDRVVFARLLTAAALILLLMSGSALAPTLSWDWSPWRCSA